MLIIFRTKEEKMAEKKAGNKTTEKNDRPRRKFNKDNNRGDRKERRAPRAPKTTEGGEH